MTWSPNNRSQVGRNAVIVLSLLGAGFFGAYLRFLPYLQDSTSYTDGRSELELSELEQLRFAVWDDPIPLPPVINTDDHEGRATVSPDGRLLVFAFGEPGLNVDLWVADLVDDQPVDPRPLALLNSSADELAPAFGPHGLWFASNRAGGEGGYDILFAPWSNGQLQPAERLPAGLNGDFDDFDPAPVPGSGAIAFSSNRPRGRRNDFDLYLGIPRALQLSSTQADTAWSVEPLAPLNTPFDEREPAYSLDSLGLLFASNRNGGEGGFDLYRSLQNFGQWTEPEALSGLNTGADERAPMPSGDGFTLLFAQGQPADLSRARSLELFRLPGRPLGWLDLTILAVLLLIALLAWLGRRWETLDILYKCLLVSLLIHVALMYWFREVIVEPEPVPIEESASTFKVRLTASRNQTQQNRRRDGEVSASPSSRDGELAPERATTQAAAQPSARSAQRQALAVPQLAGASTAAPGDTETARAEVQAAHDVTYRDAAEVAPRMSADAAQLNLAPAQVAADGPSSTNHAAAPHRASFAQSSQAQEGPSGSRATIAGRSSLTVPVVTSGPGMPGPATPVDLVSRASGGSAQAAIEVNAPAEQQGSQQQAEAPTLSLEGLGLSATAMAAQRSRGAARPGRTPGTGISQAQDLGAPRPASLPSLASRATEQPAVVASHQGDNGFAEPQRSPLPSIALADEVATSEAVTPGDIGELPGAEAAPSLSLDVSSLASAPSRSTQHRGQRPARSGRWTTGAVASAPAQPASRPLAAVIAVAAALPEADASEYEHTPYRTRFGDAKVAALAEHGGSVETEQAVAAGLAYLARMQDPEGYWGSTDDYDEKYGHVSVGKTGLALLAFLGAGHSPNSNREHAKVSARARDFLLSVQDEATGHFGYSTSYSHAIATYALSECYALTSNEKLRRPLKHAVAWIVSQQDQRRNRRRLGGWGYYYPDGRVFDSWPRTSVTSWQVMALESAQLAGLEVPGQVFADARTFLINAQDSGRQEFFYSRDPGRLNGAYPYLPGSTPAGLFALSLLGEDIRSETYAPNVRFLLDRAPNRFRKASSARFVQRAEGNLYFWYYASLALFRHGGEPWDAWNQHLQDTLLPNQRADGSWNPISLYADYAGDDNRDRSYTTAMCVLTLEVYYRYFTPLLEVR